MSQPGSPTGDCTSLSRLRRGDHVCDTFEEAWKQAGRPEQRPRIESFLDQVPESAREQLARDLINLDIDYRRRGGERPQAEDYRQRFPFLDRDWLADALAGTSLPPEAAAVGWPAVPGYEVVGELGQGGMGVVYRARQVKANRLVALKVIRADKLADLEPEERQRWIARFRTEAETVARLQHPNVVQVFEVGEHAGLPFFSMEYVDGGSLARKLAGTPLPAFQAAPLVATLAQAVAAAHQRGVVHRDLKPANILLQPTTRGPSPAATDDGEQSTADYGLRTADHIPKVTDFGLAKRLDVAADQTQTGAVLGTCSYMAPEQAAGKTKEAGPTADVYALGAILYECLTGRPPFKAENAFETLQQVKTQEPVPPSRLNPKVPRDLETICLKCLQKEPHNRYLSAEALADDLRRFAHGEPIHARPAGAVERLAKWAKRRPATAALVSVSTAAAVGLLTLAATLWYNAELRAAAVKDLAEARKERDQLDRDVEDRKSQVVDLQGKIGEKEARVGHLEKKERETEDYIYRLDYLRDIREAWNTWETKADAAHVRELLRQLYTGNLASFDCHYLWRLCNAERTLSGHKDPVICVAFSPDGRALASGDVIGMVKFWEPATGQEQAKSIAQHHFLACLAFSGNGEILAAGCRNGLIGLWEAGTGKKKAVLQDPEGSVYALAFAPDGHSLAVGTNGGTVNLWDLEKRKIRFPLHGHVGRVSGLAFSPDGERLAVASGDEAKKGEVKVWDLADKQAVLTLQEHTAHVSGVAFSPDGKLLASVSHDKTLRLYDAATGRSQAALREHAAAVLGVAFSPQGGKLATASADRTVKLWDAATGQVLQTLKGHQDAVHAVSFSPDGKILATAGKDKAVKLWDVARGPGPDTLRAHKARGRSLAFAPDGKTLASASTDGTVKLWDVALREKRGDFRHGSAVFSVAFAPDGKTLATAGQDKTVKLWDVAARGAPGILQHNNPVRGVAFAPDGRTLAAADGSAVVLWDVATKQRTTLGSHQHAVEAVAFSPDGKVVASGGRRVEAGKFVGEVKLWDAAGGQELHTFHALAGPLGSVTFSPDGKALACVGGFSDRTAVVWDLETKKSVTLPIQPSPVYAVLFVPDGKALITGSREVKVWDVAIGRERATIQGAEEAVWSLAFTRGGKLLASGNEDGTVKLWDAATDAVPVPPR